MPFFTSNGANIFVDVAGEGRPLLFVHGFTFDHRQWDEQRRVFQGQNQVFRMDLRGHGRSATSEVGNTLEGFAEDVHRALVQIDMTRLNPGFIIGHSVSADAVLACALAEPRALRGVVVLSPALRDMKWSEGWRSMFAEMKRQARQGDLPSAIERFRQDDIFAGLRDRPELFAATAELQSSFSGAYLTTNEKSGLKEPLALETCKVPILVISSKRDREEFLEAGRQVAARAPQAQVVELDDVGHFANLEAPDRVNQLLQDFFSTHS